jgi:hypothetical protein
MSRVRSAAPDRSFAPFLFVVLLAVLGLVAYASIPERASTWRDRDIKVDGSDEEWRGQELPVKGERFSLGIMNDDQWLYLCLPTKDPGTRTTIGLMGVVVWLDRAGGKKQTFGIHFPVPNPPGAGGVRRPPPPSSGGEGRAAPPEGQPQEVPGQREIGILGPGKNDARLVPIDQAGGIEARVGVHQELMVYEIRVPLHRTADHPYSPDLHQGDTVRLKIETAPLRGGPVGPGSIGGVIVPGGPGWGVSVGGAGWPRKPMVIEPIELTVNLRLARGPQ